MMSTGISLPSASSALPRLKPHSMRAMLIMMLLEARCMPLMLKYVGQYQFYGVLEKLLTGKSGDRNRKPSDPTAQGSHA